jgi:uncharacterized protein (DUF427 family)
MRATWNGQTIAESNDIVLVEGNAYFPESALRKDVIVASEHTSICPWKGTAHYYSLRVDGESNANAVWYYPDPKPAAAQIKGRVAFWKGVKVEA